MTDKLSNTELKEQYEKLAAENKKLRQKLNESNTQLNTIKDSAKDAIIMIDSQGNTTFWNPAAEYIFGYKKEEIIGKNLHEHIAPKRYYDKYVKAFKAFQETGKGNANNTTIQLYALRKDGEEIPIELSLSAFKDCTRCETNDEWCAVGIARDITNRKIAADKIRQTNEFLNHIIDSLPYPFYTIDTNTYEITLANKFTGKDAIGKKCYELTHKSKEPCYGKDHPCTINEIIHTKKPVIVEHNHFDKNNKNTVVEVHGYPLFDNYNNISQVIEYTFDITDKKQENNFKELSAEILTILTSTQDFNSSLQKIVSLIRQYIKTDAAGIRFLNEEGDYPYLVYEGFPEDHLAEENKLCITDKDGSVIKDDYGNLRLQCFCGLVLSGQTIPGSPIFTKNGSLYTNDSRALLEEIDPETDPRYKPRNKCIYDGYKSIALIPIKANNQNVGLLHVNCKEKDFYNPNMIRYFERICSKIGLAIIRKQAEENIKQSEEKYKLLAEETQAIFWEFDLVNDKWLYVAPQVESILGYIPSEWTNIRFWIDKMHPEDQKWAPAFCSKEAAKGKSHIFEYRFLKKDGNYAWILENANVKVKKGKAVKLWGYMIDITSRKSTEEKIKKSEQKFKLLADYTPNWEYWMNENREFVYISRSCEEITGYTVEEFIEKPWFIHEIVHPDDKQMFANHIDNCFDRDKRFTIKEIEIRIINAEGQSIYLNHTSRPIYDESDKRKFLGIRVSNSDITERKFAQEELKKTNEELHLATNYANMMAKKADEANRAKSEFLANMSHEIRTPLNGVIGFTDLLKNTTLSGTQKTYIEKAHTSAKLLMDLINDILDFSKIEAGKLELDEVKTDILELTANITNVIEQKAYQKDLDIKLNIEDDVPRFAVIDPVRLRQVLINLLGNAAKFTEQGYIELSLEFEKNSGEQNSGIFYFSVNDTGIGISKERQTKLFKAFVQADTSTTRKYGGTGLGLVISYKILEKMGSKLKLNSEPGKGSQFYFSLERKYEYGTPVKSAGEKSLPKEIKSDPVILIVEDTEMNIYLIKALLNQIIPGAVIIEATNGEEGVNKYKEYNPNIVLLDIQMPVKDGYTAAQDIRQHENKNDLQRKPMIALTARAVKGEKEKCLNAGMDDFLPKPMDQKDLANTLKKYLAVSTHDGEEPTNPQNKQSKTKHFDKKGLLERLGGNKKQADDLLKMAMSKIPKYIESLGNTIEEKNLENIEQAAHKLKGAASFAGFVHLEKLAEQIEYNNDENSEFANKVFGEIEEEFEEVRKILPLI